MVAISGGKGGIGKSTIAVNLAVSYAQRGARSLALDGDFGMADLNLLLGVAPGRNLLDVLDGGNIEDSLVEAHGIHLLPALNGSRRLANLSAAERARLFGKIDTLRSVFDTVIIDTASGVADIAMELAASATDIVAVATPEPLSLADAYACLKILSRHHQVSRVMVLPNMVRSPSEGDEVIARLASLVERFLGVTLVPLPAIPFDPAVAEASAAGVPLLEMTPDCPAARAIARVARRIDALSAERPRIDKEPLRLVRAARMSDGQEVS